MTEQLSLGAIQRAVGIAGIPEDERPEMIERMLILHGLIVEARPKKANG